LRPDRVCKKRLPFSTAERQNLIDGWRRPRCLVNAVGREENSSLLVSRGLNADRLTLDHAVWGRNPNEIKGSPKGLHGACTESRRPNETRRDRRPAGCTESPLQTGMPTGDKGPSLLRWKRTIARLHTYTAGLELHPPPRTLPRDAGAEPPIYRRRVPKRQKGSRFQFQKIKERGKRTVGRPGCAGFRSAPARSFGMAAPSPLLPEPWPAARLTSPNYAMEPALQQLVPSLL
jgi:hypothetical protein